MTYLFIFMVNGAKIRFFGRHSCFRDIMFRQMNGKSLFALLTEIDGEIAGISTGHWSDAGAGSKNSYIWAAAISFYNSGS